MEENFNKSKIVCPFCNSNDLVIYQEYYTTHYFKIKKNGTPEKKPYEKSCLDSSTMPFGYLCQNCGKEFGGSTGIPVKGGQI